MKPIDRSELMDLGAYEGVRERFRARIVELKKHRRLPLGADMTLIFENRDTVLFQIQEMLRTERITQEKAIAHELDTYNELVPREGKLSATLMIEYVDKQERAEMLRKLADLEGHIKLVVADRSVVANFLPFDGEEEGRLPAVNYLRFEVGGETASLFRDPKVAVSLQCDHESYTALLELTEGPRVQLAEDLEA